MSELTPYGKSVRVSLAYDEAVANVTAALQDEGFGVLSEIDVKATLKKKLDADFRRYVILGACNPQLAHRALNAETQLGLLLPCNVIVYEDGAESIVSVIDARAMMQVTGNQALAPIAAEAAERLDRVLAALAA